MTSTSGSVATQHAETDTRLTAHDRCDAAAAERACGAKAYARAILPSGGFLLFCGHHLRKHTAALAAAGAQIQDFTEDIG